MEVQFPVSAGIDHRQKENTFGAPPDVPRVCVCVCVCECGCVGGVFVCVCVVCHVCVYFITANNFEQDNF